MTQLSRNLLTFSVIVFAAAFLLAACAAPAEPLPIPTQEQSAPADTSSATDTPVEIPTAIPTNTPATPATPVPTSTNEPAPAPSATSGPTLTPFQQAQETITDYRDGLDRYADGYRGLNLAAGQPEPNANWCAGLATGIKYYADLNDTVAVEDLTTIRTQFNCPP